MPEDNEGTEVTEDSLRNMIGEVVDEKLKTFGEGFTERFSKLDLISDLADKIKGSGTDEDSLLGKIGSLIDEKLKGVSSGSNTPKGNGSGERVPKIKIF